MREKIPGLALVDAYSKNGLLSIIYWLGAAAA